MGKKIGELIKELRKELKMTQSQLAEPEMTKGMISHIEKGSACPSMKNLQHIALKLNKPIAYFFDEVGAVCLNNEENSKEGNQISSKPITHHLEEIVHALKEIDVIVKNKQYASAVGKLNQLVFSFKFDTKSKIYADILYRLGTCLIEQKEFDQGEEYIKQCIEIYTSKDLYIEASRACLYYMKRHVDSYRYDECMKVLERANELYKKSSSRDVFLEIELLTKEPFITIAQGDFDKTISVSEKVVKLSNENNIFYLTDIAYRNIAISHLLQSNFDKFLINMEKAKKYVDFTNNKYVLARIYHNYAMHANMINKPNMALDYLERYKENTEERAFYYYLEIARAKYMLGEYEDALQNLSEINYGEKIFYYIDCIYILSAKVLKGLIYNKIGKYEEAISFIEKAINEILPYTQIDYKGFVRYAYKELSAAYEALSEAYYSHGDYEKAYNKLKESNDYKAMSKK